MRSLYRRQLAMMVSIMLVSFTLLAGAFMLLSYRYIIGETRDSVERNAGYISSFTATYYRRYLTLDVQDEFYSSYVATIAMISNSHIIVADPEGSILYAAAQDSRQAARNVVPGALAALVGWMVVSAAFAFYVENFANYTVIYGALGTVIVLMMWLNLTALMLIMGAEINGVLNSLRGRRTPKAMDSKDSTGGGRFAKSASSAEENAI